MPSRETFADPPGRASERLCGVVRRSRPRSSKLSGDRMGPDFDPRRGHLDPAIGVRRAPSPALGRAPGRLRSTPNRERRAPERAWDRRGRRPFDPPLPDLRVALIGSDAGSGASRWPGRSGASHPPRDPQLPPLNGTAPRLNRRPPGVAREIGGHSTGGGDKGRAPPQRGRSRGVLRALGWGLKTGASPLRFSSSLVEPDPGLSSPPRIEVYTCKGSRRFFPEVNKSERLREK